MTMPVELGLAVREAAGSQARSVSAWLADAAGAALRNQALGVALDEWERDHGALTEQELQAAAVELAQMAPS